MSGTRMKRRGIGGHNNMRKTWKQQAQSALFGMLLGIIIPTLAVGQTATLLPDAKQQYLDDAGNPVASGTVTYYIPSTSTKKNVWLDAAEATLSTNPVLLDAAGRPQPTGQTYGDGVYRQVVKDVNNIVIWDALTTSTGGGGVTPVTPTIGDGNTVGTILPWAGFVAPPNYVFTYGQAISRATYPLFLSTVTFSSNLICTSGLNVLSGLSDTSQIRVGAPVEATCVPPGTTVTAVASTAVTTSANASISTAVVGVFFPYGNGNGSTTFNVPEFRGTVLAGRNNMGGTSSAALNTLYFGPQGPNSLGATGGNKSAALGTLNIPPYTPAGVIANGAITNTVTGGTKGAISNTTAVSAGGHAFADVGPDIVVTPTQATSVFTGTPQGGISDPFSVVQPTVTINYIIKVLPDVSSTVASGVASLGGMVGVLGCGSGLSCNSQTVSVVPATSLPASGITFTQQGVGATQVTQDFIDNRFLFPEQFGCIGDGVANDTACVQRWITAGALYGKELLAYPGNKYRLTENGTSCYSILISSTVQIRGLGGVAGVPQAWFFTDPGVRSCVDTFRIRAASDGIVNNTTFENLRIGNGTTAVGNSQIYVDTTGGSKSLGWARFINLNMESTASGWVLEFDNSDGVDPRGGTYFSTIREGNYHGGINYILTGPGHLLDHVYINTTNTSGFGLYYSQIAGGAPSTFTNNIIADGAGPVKFASGRGVIFTNNSVESFGAAPGSNGALVDFAGDVAQLISPTIFGNYIGNLSTNAGLLYNLRINNALNAVIGDGNSYTTTNATQIASGYWINNAGTNTTITAQGFQSGTVPVSHNMLQSTVSNAVAYFNRRQVSDANYTAIFTDTDVSYVSITAARTVSLPPASSFYPGQLLCIDDDSSSASSIITISAAPNGTDTIQGSNTTQVVVNQSRGRACLKSNAQAGWSIPLQSVSGDCTGSNSAGNTLSLSCDYKSTWTSYTPTITTSGVNFTSATPVASYKQNGKTLFITIAVTINTLGPGTGYIKATLPGSITFPFTEALAYADNQLGTGSAQYNPGGFFIIYPTGAYVNGATYVATGVLVTN